MHQVDQAPKQQLLHTVRVQQNLELDWNCVNEQELCETGWSVLVNTVSATGELCLPLPVCDL